MEDTHEYKMGYDAGLNGSNTTNTHFSMFSTQEKTTNWEAGKKAGEEAKNERPGYFSDAVQFGEI